MRNITSKLFPIEVYTLGIYFATSIITRTGLPGVSPASHEDYVLVTVFSIIGKEIFLFKKNGNLN